MITEWKDLEGRTIKKVVVSDFEDITLLFEDGEYALIAGSGEERHGQHWPILSDDDTGLVIGASGDG